MPTAGFHTKLPSESGGAKANPSFCEAVRGPRPDEKSGSGALPKDVCLGFRRLGGFAFYCSLFFEFLVGKK